MARSGHPRGTGAHGRAFLWGSGGRRAVGLGAAMRIAVGAEVRNILLELVAVHGGRHRLPGLGCRGCWGARLPAFHGIHPFAVVPFLDEAVGAKVVLLALFVGLAAAIHAHRRVSVLYEEEASPARPWGLLGCACSGSRRTKRKQFAVLGALDPHAERAMIRVLAECRNTAQLDGAATALGRFTKSRGAGVRKAPGCRQCLAGLLPSRSPRAQAAGKRSGSPHPRRHSPRCLDNSPRLAWYAANRSVGTAAVPAAGSGGQMHDGSSLSHSRLRQHRDATGCDLGPGADGVEGTAAALPLHECGASLETPQFQMLRLSVFAIQAARRHRGCPLSPRRAAARERPSVRHRSAVGVDSLAT